MMRCPLCGHAGCVFNMVKGITMRRGLDSQTHPAGGPSAVQNVSALRAILSNPVEASHPSQTGEYEKKV